MFLALGNSKLKKKRGQGDERPPPACVRRKPPAVRVPTAGHLRLAGDDFRQCHWKPRQIRCRCAYRLSGNLVGRQSGLAPQQLGSK
jgi:hypothetical protein